MKNIVISLKTATARREHIVQEFGKQNIGFEFFDALTPDLARPLAEKMQLNVEDEYLTGGELACFMSHVSIWQKMVDEQLPYVAIFEDDVFLGERAFDIFNSSSWIQEDWHIIKTEAFMQAGKKMAMPVDIFFQTWLSKNGKGLGVWPALVKPAGLDSDILGTVAAQGISRKEKEGRSFSHGLKKQKRMWRDKFYAMKHLVASK